MTFKVGDFVVGFDPEVSRGIILELSGKEAKVYWFMSYSNQPSLQWNKLQSLEDCFVMAIESGYAVRL